MAFIYQSTLADEFKDFLKMIGNAGQQTRGYATTFKSLDIFLTDNGHKEKKLPEQLVMAWIDSLTCKPRTKNSGITHIRIFSRYLMALGIPAFEPDYIKTHSDFVPYIFTDEEFRRIILAADNFLGNKRYGIKSSYVFPLLLRVLYGCGLRLGEALSLRWADVNLETGVLHIKHAKNDKERNVPMDPSLTALLSSYKKRQFSGNSDAVYLFESDQIPGRPFLGWTFRNWFLTIIEQAGISNDRYEKYERGISPHTLRHYFVYKSFLQSEEKGRTLEQYAPYLSAYLGHRSLLETEKYLATDYTLYRDSQKRLESAVNHVFPEVDFE